ncbi:MAG: NAD-dependent epimerase/dehydratase family protein [Acidimicrobiia bacterium]
MSYFYRVAIRYFITGATGFLGGKVARQLLDDGHELVVLARDLTRAADLAEAGGVVYQGDITDRASLRTAMEGTDGVFHLAGWYRVGARDPTPAQVINVQGTRNVLEVMAELEIPKGVYTSTLAVNSDTHGEIVDESYRFVGEHLSHYDRTKWEAHEKIARPMIQDGLPLVVVLPGVIYGLGDHSSIGDTIARFLRGRLPAVPQGAAYCWGHVADVARAHSLAMERGSIGSEYIVAGPAATIWEALTIAAQVSGRQPPRFQAPASLLRAISAILDLPGRLVPWAAAQAEVLRVAAGVTYLGDNARARQQLAYAPRSLQDGFAEYIPALMNRMGLPMQAGNRPNNNA